MTESVAYFLRDESKSVGNPGRDNRQRGNLFFGNSRKGEKKGVNIFSWRKKAQIEDYNTDGWSGVVLFVLCSMKHLKFI